MNSSQIIPCNSDDNERVSQNDSKIEIFKKILKENIIKQKKFLKLFKTNIIDLINKNEEANEKAKKLYSLFANLILELKITFTELFNEEKGLMKLLISIIIKHPDLSEIKSVFFNIIQIYNYSSCKSPLINEINDSLCDISSNFFSERKRVETCDIENLINEMYIMKDIIISIDNEKDIASSEISLENFISNKTKVLANYSRSVKEYFDEKILTIKNLLKQKATEVFTKQKNVEKKSNNGDNPINKARNEQNNTNNILGQKVFLLSNQMSEKEYSNISVIPIKKRTFYIYEEILKEGESQFIEYKDYSYPFDEYQRKELLKQYLGLLNSMGGRILLGINDNKKVIGLHLNYKDCDNLRNELVSYANDIYPGVRLNRIKIDFIPIRNPKTKKYKKDLFVVKIIILPGDPLLLYSAYTKNYGIISFIRQQTQVFALKIPELYQEIIKRYEMGTSQHKFNFYSNCDDFDDPEPEQIDVIDFEDEESDQKSNGTVDKKIKKKYYYMLKIKNIDTKLKIKEINRNFKCCGAFKHAFKGKNGENTGEGYLAFRTEESAIRVMEKYNGTNLGGNTPISMHIEKFEFFSGLN